MWIRRKQPNDVKGNEIIKKTKDNVYLNDYYPVNLSSMTPFFLLVES